MTGSEIALAVIVYLAWTTGALTGFGSVLVAATLGSHLFALDELLPILAPLNILLGGYMCVRHGRHVDRRLLLREVAPFMGAGFVAGILVYLRSPPGALTVVLGAFVVLTAGRELLRRLLRRGAPEPEATGGGLAKARGWMILAGLTHGMYASGGPMLVQAMARTRPPKAVFRATLAAVWLVMNSALTLTYALNGQYGAHNVATLGLCAAMIPLSVLTGEALHHRVDEERFRIFVYVILVAAGLSLMF
jgi:uncharacterized protein